MADFYNCIQMKKDKSILINLTDPKYNKMMIKVVKWDITDEGDLTFDFRLSSKELEDKYKNDEKFLDLVGQAMGDIISKAYKQAVDMIIENEEREQKILDCEEQFRKMLLDKGLEVPADKLSLEYAAEQNALIGMNDMNQLFAMNLETGEPIEISNVIYKILLDHPANKVVA